MKSYYNRPEATEEVMRNGWFHTGDIGILDSDGYLSIVDRKKDMILRGGFNVYPRELEEVLLTHPAVAMAAVVGVPDERLGEEVKAFIVRKPGADLTEEELIAWCAEQFAVIQVSASHRVQGYAADRLYRKDPQARTAVGSSKGLTSPIPLSIHRCLAWPSDCILASFWVGNE